MKIVFLGTPEFAVGILDAICQSGHEVIAAVTMPDKQAGRGLRPQYSPVKIYALEHNIPLLQPESLRDESFITALKRLQADVFVVVAFRMLPDEVINIPKQGTFNVHASLLPQYRGAAPIHRAIMNGETKSGVTTFFLNKGMDTGDIIDMTEVEISRTDCVGDLYDKLMVEGGKLALNTLNMMAEGSATRKQQPTVSPELLKKANKIFKEDMHICWNASAETIYNQIRGLSPFPTAYSILRKNDGEELMLKIFKAEISSEIAGLKPGTMCMKNRKKLCIHAKDSQICLQEVQLQGKKRMKIEQFLQGFNYENFTLILF